VEEEEHPSGHDACIDNSSEENTEYELQCVISYTSISNIRLDDRIVEFPT
jgi:hypothetical protein